jgi:hypothetical protein
VTVHYVLSLDWAAHEVGEHEAGVPPRRAGLDPPSDRAGPPGRRDTRESARAPWALRIPRFATVDRERDEEGGRVCLP